MSGTVHAPCRFARMAGLGAYRPQRIVTNDELAPAIDSSDDWIRSRSGIVGRHRAADGEDLVAMSAVAARNALDDAGVAIDDVDLVLVATCTSVKPGPVIAQDVARALGMYGAAAMDLGAACAGFTYGLTVASNAVRAGSARTVLVIGAEKFSDVVDPYDRSTAFLFGDGAGAAVVQPADAEGIWPTYWQSDGSQAEVLRLEGDPLLLRMDGQAVFRWAISTVPELARQACAHAGMTLDDIVAFVPHQANLRITEAVARSLKFGPEVVIARDIVDTGNTSAASIPLAITALRDEEKISSGDPLLIVGFGAGLTAAGQVVLSP